MISINKNIQLEPVTIKDQSRLVILMQRIYPPAYKHLWKNEDCSFYINKFYNPLQLQKELSEKYSEYYFVIFNSETVGITRIHYNYPLSGIPDKSSAYVHRIYLGEEAQGMGVAKSIFNWIVYRAKENQITLIWLKAMDTQEQALKFYIKEGFKIHSKTSLDFELLHEPFRGMNIMTKIL